jgi:AcrR family transcriptional regulator
MALPAPSTRERLIEAAERLFAERGVDGVSLREINRAAGARNAVAVQYHFDSRDGVIRAIVEKHDADIDARRHALLDEYEAAGAPDIRLLAAALVRPLAAKLRDRDGGPAFLQIHADLLNRPQPMVETDPRHGSIARWRKLVEPLLAEDAARLHRRFTAILYTAIELARRARSGPRGDDRLFTSYVIDVVTAILAAPVSTETADLAAERDRARARRASTARRVP